jgi:DNA repair photolyase
MAEAPPHAHKGRGATFNPANRFRRDAREAVDDGWSPPDDTPSDEEPPPLKTTVSIQRARTIIARNDSPDIPFTQSINPYQGCEHGCVYCLHGDTLILMADGRPRPLADVCVGDEIYGTMRRGWYRRYVKTRVLAHWSVIKPSYRIILEDGTSVVAGADHRFLTERGWKFVTAETDRGGPQRPYLTINNKLIGTGAFAPIPSKDQDYRIGYLCGMIRGDGLLASYSYQRDGRTNGDQHQFRLALSDAEALQRAREYLRDLRVATHEFVFQKAIGERRAMNGIRTHARLGVEQIRSLVTWPVSPSPGWSAGFLAGIFDAEGSYSQGVLRISNTDEEIIRWIGSCLTTLDFQFEIERRQRERLKPIQVVRVTGGLREHLRFLHTADPAITRKRNIEGQAVKSDARLGLVEIEPLHKALRLYDITTETGDFIANGVVSHNCYARPSHAFLDLSPGLDFETRLFAKPDAAALLRTELAHPGYRCEPIALGTNTDPYQPIERGWKITRQVIEVLAECEHPLTITTKGVLILRDLDLLAPMAAKNLARVYVSIAMLDRELARKLDPRAPSPQRRLEMIKALSEAGVPVGVSVAPVIPQLTDKDLEAILEAAAAHGARLATWVMLRLPYEVKDLFRDWLAQHYPLRAEHVMSIVQQMRGGRDNDPAFGSRMRGQGLFADLIARRFQLACKRLGLNQDRTLRLDTTRFRPPKRSATGGQLDLFD